MPMSTLITCANEFNLCPKYYARKLN